MSVPKLVQQFYDRIWNGGDLEAVDTFLSEGFLFRGSLGSESKGRGGFADYVRFVKDALSNFRCEILECITEDDRAFAKVRFSGIHIREFRGNPPTGLRVHWLGAALFRFEKDTIAELWVLGDLNGLDDLLKENLESIHGTHHEALRAR
ncbi:MAG: ester cyclase [Candidatus Eremiobacteraeota bacterium]|nr:ester cyclase [Candidatus Eremiobacteraeota bacterium]